MEMTLSKYHSFGNDYLIYDCRKNEYELKPEDIRNICSRRFGAGGDGILAGPVPMFGKTGVKIYNPDGSEAAISGNGLCIFAKYLKDAGYVVKKEVVIQTRSRAVTVHYHNEAATEITISMGRLYCGQTDGEGREKSEFIPVEYQGRTYQGMCVWMGNLHCIIPMEEISKETVCRIGKQLEKDGRFPDGVNTQIIKVRDKNNLDTEVYERGAGYTLASGSSCCAAAGVASLLNLTDPCVYVHMPGGTLTVRVDQEMNAEMTGKADYIGEIRLSYEFLEKYHIG
ncbi:MAG TPA: diaminopimelate epimerase [Candidatus Choladousia intestinavium]|uniref:Diaminopimelate epimerase n=1 Tax=Candidatus Choladousia intestinavium TaxID=2840727 RepID=A0A9D1ABX7_9FIRM|nr:diaminopimelate epimerase [Candidatus Choladousia intestinavium]